MTETDWRTWLLHTFTNNDDVDRSLSDDDLKREVLARTDAAPDLAKVARACWHLCQSLLAESDGVHDELLREVAEAAETALAKAGVSVMGGTR